jgi:hypothetical protein
MNELLLVDKLKHYAAVEAFAGDTDETIVRAVLEGMTAAGKKCRGIQTLGRHSIGATNFVRFRMDVPYRPEWLPNRGSITMQPDGTFRVCLRGGREGNVPMTTMLSLQLGHRVFHGNAKAGWKRQFS